MLRSPYRHGFRLEAIEYWGFVLDAVSGGDLNRKFDPPVTYGIGGERDLTERTLDHLSGWRGARPVRVGNGAWNQKQHDVCLLQHRADPSAERPVDMDAAARSPTRTGAEGRRTPVTKHRLLIVNGILLLALLGGYFGLRSEDAVASRTDFLQPLNLPFQGWKATDMALKPDEMDMLKPDAVLMRHYKSQDGQSADLAVIAGHRKQSIHTPAFCMVGSGWEVLTQGEHEIPLQKFSINTANLVHYNYTYNVYSSDFCYMERGSIMTEQKKYLHT